MTTPLDTPPYPPAATPAGLLRARYPDPTVKPATTPTTTPEADTPADVPPASIALDPMEARILLCHVLGWPRTALITRADEVLPPAQVQHYRHLAMQRLAGVPIAQLVGTREFYGLALAVTPDVLIPRPETELLVELALAACRTLPQARVLDLGTGSGAIALAIATHLPAAQVSATDRSAAALAVARANGERLLATDRAGGPIIWHLGDWYQALGPLLPGASQTRYDVIVSNPPYIRRDDPHLQQGDLRFEPRGALTDEADGLDALRILIAQAPDFLVPGGQLWLEHGYDQSAEVAALLCARGFEAVRSEQDLAGIPRATGGRYPGTGST